MAKQPAKKIIEIKPVVDPDAKVYPRSISGPYTRWRWAFVWLTQIIFYGLCWLPWHGRQAILFDIDTRKFYFFDLVLWPQDTIYLVLLMILGAFTLFLFTAVAGRLWCGYTCPQTVYNGNFPVVRKADRGRTAAAHQARCRPVVAAQAGAQERQAGDVDRLFAVDGDHFRRLFHADPRSGQ